MRIFSFCGSHVKIDETIKREGEGERKGKLDP